MDNFNQQEHLQNIKQLQAHTLVEKFIHNTQQAYKKGNLDVNASFAKPFRDLRSDAYIYPSMSDVLAESLDYTNGPELKEVFMIFLKAVDQGDQQANALLQKMASTYARFSEPCDEAYEAMNEDFYDDEDDACMLGFYR